MSVPNQAPATGPMAKLRGLAMPIGVVAAVLLAYLYNPWFNPDATLAAVVTVSFWILSILLVVVLFEARKDPGAHEVEVEGPAITRFLFSNSRAGLLWLPIRLFVGFEFLAAGLHKFGDPGWIGGTGTALAGYWTKAVAISPDTGKGAITFEWYRDFLNLLLNNHTAGWFAQLITFGELAVGLGLIVGLFTGLAAFFGALMNMSFLLAGSGSTNPVLFTLGIGLIVAWRVAGYYGLDRYVLPRLGTPWRPGALFLRMRPEARGA
jgi:thiosulfate dehydrogenase [quinone] large subunit